jgi:hypothetical protein
MDTKMDIEINSRSNKKRKWDHLITTNNRDTIFKWEDLVLWFPSEIQTIINSYLHGAFIDKLDRMLNPITISTILRVSDSENISKFHFNYFVRMMRSRNKRIICKYDTTRYLACIINPEDEIVKKYKTRKNLKPSEYVIVTMDIHCFTHTVGAMEIHDIDTKCMNTYQVLKNNHRHLLLHVSNRRVEAHIKIYNLIYYDITLQKSDIRELKLICVLTLGVIDFPRILEDSSCFKYITLTERGSIYLNFVCNNDGNNYEYPKCMKYRYKGKQLPFVIYVISHYNDITMMINSDFIIQKSKKWYTILYPMGTTIFRIGEYPIDASNNMELRNLFSIQRTRFFKYY